MCDVSSCEVSRASGWHSSGGHDSLCALKDNENNTVRVVQDRVLNRQVVRVPARA